MNQEQVIEHLQKKFPLSDIQVSERGERLLVNSHVIKGITLHEPIFRNRQNVADGLSFFEDLVRTHLNKHGNEVGDYGKPVDKKTPKHQKSIPGYTDMAILATRIGNLHYETLEEFIGLLSAKLKKDAIADHERGRNKLSQSLMFAANDLKMAQQNVGNAWLISKPYMKDEEKI